MRKLLLLAALGVALAGCNQTVGGAITSASNWATNADAAVKKYAPIVGKTLVKLGDIVYQVECKTTAASSVAHTSSKILNVVAPSSTAASKFATRVQQNDDLAAQLCPLVDDIKVAVGSVPQTAAPAQVIATTPGT
jgi:hypothetical protein